MMARCFHGLKMFPRVTPNILWYDFITWTLCTQKAIAPLPYRICLTHAFLIACFLASWTVLDFEITLLHRIQRPTEKNTHNLTWRWKSPSLCWEKIPFLDSWSFFAFPFQMTEITIPESRASFGSCFFSAGISSFRLGYHHLRCQTVVKELTNLWPFTFNTSCDEKPRNLDNFHHCWVGLLSLSPKTSPNPMYFGDRPVTLFIIMQPPEHVMSCYVVHAFLVGFLRDDFLSSEASDLLLKTHHASNASHEFKPVMFAFKS